MWLALGIMIGSSLQQNGNNSVCVIPHVMSTLNVVLLFSFIGIVSIAIIACIYSTCYERG